MRFGLRTLLILLTLGPPVLACGWFASARWRVRQDTDGWIEIAGPGSIDRFEAICTFAVDEPETKSSQAMDEPTDVDDPPSLDPFGMP